MMQHLRPLVLVALLGAIALAAGLAPASFADTTASGTIKVKNMDGTEPDTSNQPKPGDCGVGIIGERAGPGTLTITGQGDPGEAGPDTFTFTVAPAMVDGAGNWQVLQINLRSGQYKADLGGANKVFRVTECPQAEPPAPDNCPAGTGPRQPDGTCPVTPPDDDDEDDDDDDTDDDDDDDDDDTDVGGVQIERGVIRIWGPTRMETAINASRVGFADGTAAAVVLARSDLYPDALAGTPLAVGKGAPLLLTHPPALHAGTEEEIRRVLPPGRTVYVLGGTAAVSQAVVDRLEAIGYQVVRYGGPDRFHTAEVIARVGLENPAILMLANGGDFPDALTAGTAAGVVKAAVLLTADESVPQITSQYLTSRPGAAMFAIGGPAARALPDVTPVFGATRYHTAVAVAQRFVPNPEVVGLATGLVFADALTGGTLVASNGGPMVLSDPRNLSEPVPGYLGGLPDLGTVILFGGTAALSSDVEEAVRSIVLR